MPRIALSCLILLTNLGLLVACKKEKLENQYNKLKKEAFEMSKFDRKKSDELEKKADDVLKEIQKLN